MIARSKQPVCIETGMKFAPSGRNHRNLVCVLLSYRTFSQTWAFHPYDQDGVTASVTERHPEAAIIVPPRSNAVPSDTAATAPTQRYRHLQHIAKHGRMAWQAASGYTKRAKAETGMSRFKQVIGDGLRSHTDGRQATEVGVAVHVLNRMLELGRPNSVRIA